MLKILKLCNHNFVKTELVPHSIYYDYSGFKIGIFKCYCTKCGKIKNRKYW